MSKQLDLTIFERGTMRVKDKATSFTWEVRRDYISNEKSRFELDHSLDCRQGDYVMAKLPDGKNSVLLNDGKIKPFYFGLVDSFETTEDGHVLLANDIYNLANFDFAATPKSGFNSLLHIRQLLNRYLLRDQTKLVQRVNVSGFGLPVAFNYQPSDPPTTTNLVDYLVHFFVKYGLVWEVDSIGYDEGGQLVVYTVITKRDQGLQLKNNVHDFQNWELYVNPANQSAANMLQIVDKTTNNSEAPTILSTWYVNQEGKITQDPANVELPTRNKVYIYDQTAADKPTYEAVARSELSASNYSHEISFDVLERSDLLRFTDLSIGLLAKIVYDGVTYNSVLTGYAVTSEDAIISLKFGHTRSTIKSLLARRV